MRPAVYETAAFAAEPRRRNGGSPRCCPVLCGLRDRCIAAMLATRTRREGGVEPPSRFRIGMRVLAGTGVRVTGKPKMVEHQGIAPRIPVWKVLADGHQRVSLN